MRKQKILFGMALVVTLLFTGCNTMDNTETITQEQAKQAALQDAGITEAEVDALRISEGIEDGRQVYDVKFYVEDEEYDYEIDAQNGDILERDREIEDNL